MLVQIEESGGWDRGEGGRVDITDGDVRIRTSINRETTLSVTLTNNTHNSVQFFVLILCTLYIFV